MTNSRTTKTEGVSRTKKSPPFLWHFNKFASLAGAALVVFVVTARTKHASKEMRIFDIFYLICVGGMILAFFAPNLSFLRVPNFLDRYRYQLKHKLECNIRVNGNPDDQFSSISLGADARPNDADQFSHPRAVNIVEDSMRQLRSDKKVSVDTILQEAVDKVFENSSVRKSLGKGWKNLSQHSSLKNVVGKLTKMASDQDMDGVDNIAKTVGKIFSQVEDLHDDSTDNAMRKIFEQLRDDDSATDDTSEDEYCGSD